MDCRNFGEFARKDKKQEVFEVLSIGCIDKTKTIPAAPPPSARPFALVGLLSYRKRWGWGERQKKPGIQVQ